MSNDKKDDKSKSFKPTEYITDPIQRTITLFFAWLIFNGLLVFLVWFVVRVTHYDLDPIAVSLAERLTQERVINLLEVAPGIQTIRHVYRLDADADNFREWVVLYSYDTTTQGQGPFGAAVYDVDRCRPPAIVTYELRPYDYNYVAENLPLRWAGAPTVQDINGDGQQELVLDIGNDMSIFRWFDHTLDCVAPGPGLQGYELLGSFRGSGGVYAEGGGRIVVMDRAYLDRSQTAIKRVYTPDANGSYLRPEGGGLYPPQETGVDFAFGVPVTATQLYYPEKAVLAFYLNLGQDNKAAKAYLSKQAQDRYPIGTYDFGIALPREQLARVLVKELSYTPNMGEEQLHYPQDVAIVVVGVRSDGYVDEANPRRVVWRVIGVSKEGALPYNCEWRLDELISITVP
jgi:hypothetical protein